VTTRQGEEEEEEEEKEEEQCADIKSNNPVGKSDHNTLGIGAGKELEPLRSSPSEVFHNSS